MAVATLFGFHDKLDDKQVTAIGLKKRKISSIQTNDGLFRPEKLFSLIHKDAYPRRNKDFFNKLCRAMVPDPDLFKPKQEPGTHDWMSFHDEPGQTFADFLSIHKNLPDSTRRTIYLLPMVFFEDPVPEEVLKLLQIYASIFFGLPIKVLKTINMKDSIPNRENIFSGTLQVNAGALLKKLEGCLPPDAFCLAGITMCDMYPRETWNFVFGLANCIKRCGVYSLARYLPTFGEHRTSKVAVDRRSLTKLLVRSCKVMCHEIGHMFGIKHCIFYECMMNGSNHLEEADERPIHMCPVCLRKLQYSCQFDIEDRYRNLREFCQEHRLRSEQDWFTRRLKQLEGKIVDCSL